MSKKMNWINLTIVGEFWAVVMISSVYGIGIISFQLANQPGGMLILPVVHFVLDLFLVTGKPIPTRISLARFLNEAAFATIAGWLLFLVYVFTFGILSTGDSRAEGEKQFGLAFGAGVGLMVICGPCAMVAVFCTSYLTRMNAPPTPFFGDD